MAALRAVGGDPLALAGDVARGPEPEGVLRWAAGVAALVARGPDKAQGWVCKKKN